jgi:hypothetical protein
MALRELPLEILTHVCQQLSLRDLVRVAAICKRFRHGGLETMELPTESPVVTALCKHAFPRPELVPSTRPDGCSNSWVAYLARCARQSRCREAPPMSAGAGYSVFLDATRQLQECDECFLEGQGRNVYPLPNPIAAIASPWVRLVVRRSDHCLALSWDGRIYSWGENAGGQLGHGDQRRRASPELVEGLQDVRGIATDWDSTLAVTQSGAVFRWGAAFRSGEQKELPPIIVEGLQGVRVRRVCR